MGLSMVLFWGILIVAIFVLARQANQNSGAWGNSGGDSGSRALDLLKERYAKGEITRDEFESMKKDLRG